MPVDSLALALLVLVSGCDNVRLENEIDRRLQRMVDQPRCGPDETTALFQDGACNRHPPDGVVVFGARRDGSTSGRDEHGQPLESIPLAVDRTLILAGRRHFDVFCAACHGLLGDGRSQVAENMRLRRPPSLLDPVVQALSDGEIYRVMTEGYGLMPSYAQQLEPEQRWAVVAYLRVLALSQSLRLVVLTPTQRAEAARWLR